MAHWMKLFAAQFAAAGLALTSLSSASMASDPGPRWTMDVMPYAWAPFLKGQTIINGRVADIDFTPIDVLKNLDALPFMGYAEARKDRVSFYGDVFYAKLGASGSLIRARNFGPIGVGVNISGDGEFEQLVAEFGGSYEVAKWNSGAGFTAFDVIGGFRYWRQELEVGVSATGAINIAGLQLVGGRAVARSGSVDWLDPLVGFRVRHGFAPGQEVFFRADVGGFDVGSELTWNVLGAYKFDFSVQNGVTYSGLLGYRILDIDYTKSSYSYDVLQHGPVMGLSLRF